MQGVEDAVTMLAQAGASVDVAAAQSSLVEKDAKMIVQAAHAACLEDEVLSYVAGEGATRFSLLSLVPKPK